MFDIEYEVVPKTESSDASHHIQNIKSPNILSKGFESLRFPLYPITILLSTKGESFNSIEICCNGKMLPSDIVVYFSNDGEEFQKVGVLSFQGQKTQKTYVIRALTLPKLVSSQFIQLDIKGIAKQPQNLCKQVAIFGLKIYNKKFNDTKYLYNLESCFSFHPGVLDYLRSLELTMLNAKADRSFDTCVQCQRHITETIKEYTDAKVNREDPARLYELEQQCYQKAKKFRQMMTKSEEIRSQPQTQLKQKANRAVQPNPVPKQIIDIFGKYKERVNERALKMLSSPLPVDKQKFIINLWEQLKQLPELPEPDEQLLVNTVLHFIHNEQTKIVSLALQILNLALKKGMGKVRDYYYERLVRELFEIWSKPANRHLRRTIEETLLSVFPITNQLRFLDIVANSPNAELGTVKLELILQIVKHHELKSYTIVLNYVSHLFHDRNIPKQTRDLCIEILSVIASKTSVQKVMQSFNDLPTHVMLNVQKSIKEKTGKKEPSPTSSARLPPQLSQTCQYCKKTDVNFLDADLYDLHCFKQCVYLSSCQYCQAVIEIPFLHNHYLKQCTEAKNFRKCADCGLAIHRTDDHDDKCLKKQLSVCPLCQTPVLDKATLDKHILEGQCSQNKRMSIS